MRTDRDNQRSKVYAAERASGLCKFEQTIPDAELQDWVNAVLDRRVIRSRWGARTVEVKRTSGRGGATAYGTWRINASPGARNEYVMLHEIAHVLTPRDAGHGPEYCGVLLFLVRNVLGKEAHAALLEAMRKHRVKRSNSSIPRVRSDVPAPAKVRERQERREQREAAIRKIRVQVERGYLTWRQVAELAKTEQRAAARKAK